jgi:hypothetical protein
MVDSLSAWEALLNCTLIFRPDQQTNVFHATANSLQSQANITIQTPQSLQRILAANERQRIQNHPDAYILQHQTLFSAAEYIRPLEEHLGQAGLPNTSDLDGDSFNPAWLFALQSFLPQPVHLLSFRSTKPNDIVLIIYDTNIWPFQNRIVHDTQEIQRLRYQNQHALWLLEWDGNFFGLIDNQPCVDQQYWEALAQDTFETETKVVLDSLSDVNLALSGHLSEYHWLDQELAYFMIDRDTGYYTVVPYRHVMGLGVGVADFTLQTVDIDSTLLIGTDLDLIAHYFFSIGTSTTIPGHSRNTPIPEAGYTYFLFLFYMQGFMVDCSAV